MAGRKRRREGSGSGRETPRTKAPTTQSRGASHRGASTAAQRRGAQVSIVEKKTARPAKARTWTYPEPQEYVPSDDERERRRKKPRVGPVATAKPVFAIAPTKRSRSLNRKKLSTKAKQQRKFEAKAASNHVAPAFSRGSSASVRKLLTLQLGDHVDGDLVALAQFVGLTPDERAFRRRVFGEIQSLVCGVFPDATVELYGSSSSGMETFRSDLDISIGNLDFAKMRTKRDDSATIAADVDNNDHLATNDDDDDDQLNPAGYVMSDTDGEEASSPTNDDDDDEPTFSLNLAIPGLQPDGSSAPTRAASASLKSPWNPTLRRQKMRQLRALQQLLMTHRPQYKIKCLSKAKIPILMVVDSESGLHIDLGVNREAFQASDHGRTTALVTQLQQALGEPFFAIVVFLKEFLHQFDLDKPFTGGLGSYRLYMMVAYIFTTRFPPPKKNQPPSPPSAAKVLLLFLEVFGNRKKRGFWTTETELPVRHGTLMDVVDFHAVFRLDDCVDKFAMAFDIISKHRHLGGVVYEETLQAERRDCAKRILQHLEREEHKRKAEAVAAAQTENDEEITEEEESDYDDEKYR